MVVIVDEAERRLLHGARRLMVRRTRRGDEAERNEGPPNERGDQGGAESGHAAQTFRTRVTQAS